MPELRYATLVPASMPDGISRYRGIVYLYSPIRDGRTMFASQTAPRRTAQNLRPGCCLPTELRTASSSSAIVVDSINAFDGAENPAFLDYMTGKADSA